MGKRGRPPAAGKVYYLGRLRFRPGLDPPELQEVLEAITSADSHKRADILRAALVGGAGQTSVEAETIEDGQTSALIDEMFDNF